MPQRAAIYLDSNAGVPLKPEVLAALSASYYNPSSQHSHGRETRRLLGIARNQVARSLQLSLPDQLTFTSSGTESNQLAIRSILETPLQPGNAKNPAHWVTSTVEHESVLQLVDWFKSRGGEVSFVEVDRFGAPRADSLAELIRPETKLVSLIWAHNETGVISDVDALARVCQARGVALHLDGAQAWGKLPIDLDRLQKLGVSSVSFSGYKIGGMMGTGVLFSNAPTFQPLILGKQQGGRRGGTENVAGTIALGIAASLSTPEEWSARVAPARDRLEREILARIPGAQVNGGGTARVANTLNLSFGGIEKDGLVAALDLAGYSVSSGPACSSGVVTPSNVLVALGRNRGQAAAAVRISLVDDRYVWEDLVGFIDSLEKAVIRLRQSSVWGSAETTATAKSR